jgi:hypothetical protein
VGEIKSLKFRPQLAEMIRNGKKWCTWRIEDDKNIQLGDKIEFLENMIEKPFATALIIEVVDKTLGTLNVEDYIGHEGFKDDNEMYETYRDYYGPQVSEDTKIIRFQIEMK